MQRFSKLIPVTGLLLIAGCVSPQNTRLPSLSYGDPRAERQSYAIHNPLPEREAPFAGALPPGFDIQRSEATRTRERYVNPYSHNPDGSSVGTPASATRYSQTVRE